MPNRVYQDRRRLADQTFPYRMCFDAPQPDLREMVDASDGHFGWSWGGTDRVYFYFATIHRLMAFSQRFGNGREMSEFEKDQNGVGREGATDHWVSIKLEK